MIATGYKVRPGCYTAEHERFCVQLDSCQTLQSSQRTLNISEQVPFVTSLTITLHVIEVSSWQIQPR